MSAAKNSNTRVINC